MSSRPVRRSRASSRPPRRGRTTKPSIDKVRNVSIFISYASEDRNLVNAIHDLLTETFAFAPLAIFRDVEIRQGENYAESIDRALDAADILLVVHTERMKLSHYTGYEVGYFARSKRGKPKGAGGFERIYIPFCVGSDIPDYLHYVQGIVLDKNDVYKVTRTIVDNAVDSKISTDHPIYQFLLRLSDLLRTIVWPTAVGVPTNLAAALEKAAVQLYQIVHEYLQGLVSSEIYPERKWIIRSKKRPEITKGAVNLTPATIELVGDFSEVLKIGVKESAGREYQWDDFSNSIPADLRTSCVSGIQKLVAESLQPEGGDNYHVVATASRDRAFRLFVSKVITYVSEKMEIHIYVVQIRTKYYGDPETTRLLKAVSVGLGFRFLLLEKQSKFRPDKLSLPTVKEMELRALVTELAAQITLLLKESADANLEDPEFIIQLWGSNQDKKLEEMIGTWERSQKALFEAIDQILSSENSVPFKERKTKLVEALESLCGDIDEMNFDFTSKAMQLLLQRLPQEPVRRTPAISDRTEIKSATATPAE